MMEDADASSSDLVFKTKQKSSPRSTSPWIQQTKHKATEVMQFQIKRDQFVEEQLKEEIRMLRVNL